jgi:hypothetical protein
VPEHDAVDVDLVEHRRGDLAGVRAVRRLVHVLGEDLEVLARRRLHGRLERGERDAHRDVHVVRRVEQGQERLDERLRLADRLVHLPVAGDEALAAHREHLDAGERLALDELERGAAAGGQVRHVVGEAELHERRGAVAAADDGRPAQPATASATARCRR